MNNYLSSSQLRSQLLQAGALIDETQPLCFYQVPRKQGDESNRHFLTKLMIFKTAQDLGHYPFLEIPVHQGITDLLIIPGPLYVQVEYCQGETQLKSRQEKYYSLFSCKNYDAELLVINYKNFPTKDQEIDHWHRILAPKLGLQKMNWYIWKKIISPRGDLSEVASGESKRKGKKKCRKMGIPNYRHSFTMYAGRTWGTHTSIPSE